MPGDTVPEMSSSLTPAWPSGRVVVPTGEGRLRVSRRKALVIGFWAGLGTMMLAMVSAILTSLYPRGISGFGSKIFVGTIDALEPGKKIHNLDAKTWLVRLDAEQARHNPPAQEGAVLAFYQKCPHRDARFRTVRSSRARTRATTRRMQAGSSVRVTDRHTAMPVCASLARHRERWTCFC